MTDPLLRAIGDAVSTMQDRDTAILKAVAAIVKDRISSVPDITVQVDTRSIADAMTTMQTHLSESVQAPAPSIVVEVDMSPVADAIAAMSKAFLAAMKELAGARELRKVTITHDDGSTSVVQEE